MMPIRNAPRALVRACLAVPALLAILAALPAAALAQTPEVSGTWKGVLTQDPGGTRGRFELEMVLEQEGDEVRGTSRISIPGTEFYGVMELRGRIRGDVLVFEEAETMDDHPEPDTRWCVKRGELEIRITPRASVLSGPWTAPECSPGTIRLTREIDPCADDEDAGDGGCTAARRED